MGCTGRYSEAWEYVSFWCQKNFLTGFHDGGAAAPALQDSHVNFRGSGVVANVGMVLYNLTTGLDGEVTSVTDTTITATGVTWDVDDKYRIVTLRRNKIAEIELQLDITAANIHAALAATGACDCTLASWALEFFKKLNIIEAGVMNRCPCTRTLDANEQLTILEWMTSRLDQIRTGELEPCAGHTGSDWPAMGWAEQTVTEFNVPRIILNTEQRES